MSLKIVVAVVFCLLSSATWSFSFIPQKRSSPVCRSSTVLLASVEETDVERLLRKARELRAAAEQAEQEVHENLLEKKSSKDSQTDRIIEDLIDSDHLVNHLRDKKLAVSTLESIVDRLDEREVIAEGQDHVEWVNDQPQRVFLDEKNEPELQRLDGMIDRLIDAVSVLDAEFRDSHAQGKISHAEQLHWGGGKCAESLQDRINQRRRERSEQFKKRLEEFREAQRLKDDDDHKFKGYKDMGTLGG